MSLETVFTPVADLLRWVPFKLVWNPTRQKYDKIPSTGVRNLATSNPNDWMTLVKAGEISSSKPGLSGVGIVLTGGIEHDGYTLVGFDFDKVDRGKFRLPFKGYLELSPSKTGYRSFAWVPTEWAKRFKDSVVHPPHCDHCEIYFGTSPRFLTVTFDVVDELPFPRLTQEELDVLEGWSLKPFEAEKKLLNLPEGIGTPIDIKRVGLSPDQTHLVDGTGHIDRSAVLHGLLIKLIDQGVPKEDLLATMFYVPALWKYCMAHRNETESKAFQFAGEEISRAFAKSQTGMRQALIGFNSKWQAIDPKPKNGELTFPKELYEEAPGLVGEIARWIQKASYAPRMEFSYACALSMVACLIGPYCVHGTRRSKMNLYMAMVGATGTGKNEAMDNMATLLAATDAKDCISDFPASEAAMRRVLSLTPNVLIRVDELAHKFESMRGSSNGSSLGRMVLEMYNGARLPPKPYADSKKSLDAVENPYVQIIGGTTDKVWDVLRTENMADGTLNRFLFICLPDTPEYKRNYTPSAEIPHDFLNRLNAFFRAGHLNDLIGYAPPGFGRKITFSQEVEVAIQHLDRAIWELQNQDNGELYSRFIQNVNKIAAILAVADGKSEVTMEYFEQGRKFIKWCITNTYHKVSTRMADTNFERSTKRLLAKLEKEGGKMTVRNAYKFMHISRREMEELTSTLTLSGDIIIEADETEHRNGAQTEWIYLLEKEGE